MIIHQAVTLVTITRNLLSMALNSTILKWIGPPPIVLLMISCFTCMMINGIVKIHSGFMMYTCTKLVVQADLETRMNISILFIISSMMKMKMERMILLNLITIQTQLVTVTLT